MRLYHTSNQEVRSPDVSHGRKNADFGQGFYLTPDREFARRWARADAVVNEYELDEHGLSCCRFTRDVDWFTYIFQNRRAQDRLMVDFVAGPIANDTIYETFGIITSGLLRPEDALRLLRIGPEYRQIALKTEKAVHQLTWLSAERLSETEIAQYRQLVAEEDQTYQAMFAAEVERISGGGNT